MSASQSQITTAEQLLSLAPGTIVRACDGRPIYRGEGSWVGCTDGPPIEYSPDEYLPGEVIYPLPAAPPVSDTTAATIAPEQRMAVVDVMARHQIECTGPGEVTCYGCREDGWISPHAYRLHLADAVLAALGLTVTERSEVLTDETGAEK